MMAWERSHTTQQVLRHLGYGNAGNGNVEYGNVNYGNEAVDDELLNEIAHAEEELINVCGDVVKFVAGTWACEVNPDLGFIHFNEYRERSHNKECSHNRERSHNIESKSLAQHMQGATFISFFAVTLGVQADLLINRYGVSNMRRSVITDAVASVMVNNQCKKICAEIPPPTAFHKPTKRFSAGYGDFGLQYQQNILTMLDANKRIGLTLTQSNMLAPSKSVTALMGWVNENA